MYSGKNAVRVRFSSAVEGLSRYWEGWKGFGITVGPQSGALFTALSGTLNVWSQIDIQEPCRPGVRFKLAQKVGT